MKKIFLFLVLAVLVFACDKEEGASTPPTILLKTSSEFTQNNAIVEVGRRLYFGIVAQGLDANITNFTIKKILTNGSIITVLDSGLNASSLNINKLLYQNVEDTVVWQFTVMDKNRMKAQTTIKIFKDPNSQFGGILYFTSIKMGYQNNTEFGQFLDPTQGKVYFSDSATLNQNDIEVLTYHIFSDGVYCPVLSSPGEMDNYSVEAMTFYPTIVNWTSRPYTLWDISIDNGSNPPLTNQDFDNAQNDSLLIVAYHEVWGKKKFRFVESGKIIPFLTSKGKKGLIKIISADNVDGTGMMEFALKIQQ